MILHILVIIAYGIAALLVGLFLFNAFQLPLRTYIFAVLIGHMLITAGYALYVTNGHTYLAIPVALLIAVCVYSFIHTKRTGVPFRKYPFTGLFFPKTILVLIIVSSIAYLTMYFRVYTLYGELKKIHFDYSFYGGVADYMNQFRVETIVLDPIKTNYNYQIYHYFELWNAALLSKLLNITGTQALLLITYPFHLALFLIGLATFAFENKKVPVFLIVLAALFMTPLGILYNQALQILQAPHLILIGDLGLLTLQGMKLFAIYIIVLVFITEIIDQPFNLNAVLLWLISLFIYPTALPFALGLLVLFFVFPHLKKLFLHYPVHVCVGSGLTLALLIMVSGGAVFYSFYEVSRYLVCFPLLGGIIFIQNKNVQEPLARFALSSLAAIFISMLTLKMLSPYLSIIQDPSVFQLIMNFAQPVCLILSVVILMHLFIEKSLLFQTLSTSLIIGCYFLQSIHLRTFNRGPATKHIDLSVIKALSVDPNKLIAFERNPDDYLRSTTSWAIYFDIPMDNTRWLTSHYFPIALTLPDSTAFQQDAGRQSLYRNCVQQSSFYTFMNARARELSGTAQQKFTRAYHIDNILFYSHD